MRHRTFGLFLALAMSASLVLLHGTADAGDEEKPAGTKEMKEVEAEEMDEAKRAQKAADVLGAMLKAEDREIPEYLLSKAEGIAVIPHVVKGAFMVGGRFGKGLVSARRDDGTWSAPVYVDIGGASYGFQIGVEATDLVLVFVEKGGLEALLKDKLELGGNATIAAGPLGRKASVGTNVTLDSAIYSYSRTKGVFAGVSLEGAVLNVDGSANQEIYGKEMTADQILNGKDVATPKAAMPFLEALRTYVPEKQAES